MVITDTRVSDERWLQTRVYLMKGYYRHACIWWKVITDTSVSDERLLQTRLYLMKGYYRHACIWLARNIWWFMWRPYTSKIKISKLSFADEFVILSTSHHGLQNALKKLEDYCYKWQLSVNVKKTKVMTFQKSYSPTSHLYYKNVPLIETKEYNCLGNVIDYKGNFKRAIQELTKKGLKVFLLSEVGSLIFKVFR